MVILNANRHLSCADQDRGGPTAQMFTCAGIRVKQSEKSWASIEAKF